MIDYICKIIHFPTILQSHNDGIFNKNVEFDDKVVKFSTKNNHFVIITRLLAMVVAKVLKVFIVLKVLKVLKTITKK